MKQKISSFVVSLLIAGLMMVLPTMAEDMMANQTHMAMEKSHAATMDQQIRKTNVKGYTLVYRLIDMGSSMQGMNMAGTYHLMVTITDSKGTAMNKAVVEYLVKGPDGNEQKVTPMKMGDGFGANVKLSTNGSYMIKVKAVIRGKDVIDSFKYNKTK